MRKINELIKELCPNGVEYRRLEKCCNILDNKRKPIKKGAREKGEYPYYGANGIQDYVSDYIFDGKFVLVGEDGSVINDSGNPIVNWAEGKIWVNNHAHIIEEIPGVNLRYVFYYIQTIDVTDLIHGNIPKLNQGDFKNLKIAIPPKPIQEEIVKILDRFSESEVEIEAELESELELRKKQYQYYLDKLFMDTEKKYGVVKFETFAQIQRGGNFQKKHYVEKGLPCIHYGQIYVNYGVYTNKVITYLNDDIFKKQKKAHKNDVIMAVTSENMEDVCKAVAWIGDGDIAVSGHSAIISHNQNAKYLSYYFRSRKFQVQKQRYARGVKVIEFQPDKLNKIEIPLPPPEVQKRIADILDEFEILTNRLTKELPEEIQLRRKQYEYYRNKLLNFEELK